MPALLIRRLVPLDAAAYQALRLMALHDAPTAFSATYAGECDTPLVTIAHQMAPESGRNRFGAFDGAAEGQTAFRTADYLMFALIYFLLSFTVIYFNAALVACFASPIVRLCH